MAALAVGCPSRPTAVTPFPATTAWPPVGPGRGDPWSEPATDPLEALAPVLRPLGWTPRTVRVVPEDLETAEAELVVVAEREDGTGGWLLVPPVGLRPSDPSLWPILAFPGEAPLPVWFLRRGRSDGDLALIVEAAADEDWDGAARSHAAVRITPAAAGPVADPLWEALEPADHAAVVDLEGSGLDDVVAVRWYDSCPDPMALSVEGPCAPPPSASGACDDAEPPAADPCLIVRVWNDGDGVPETFRVVPRADGTLSSTGHPVLDRAVALLQLSRCRYLDLRSLTVLEVDGLREAGVSGELVEGPACGPDPESPTGSSSLFLALLDPPDGVRLPSGEIIDLARPAGGGNGYEVLDDLDGDGVPEWLWREASEAGVRTVVTRGPGRAPARVDLRGRRRRVGRAPRRRPAGRPCRAGLAGMAGGARAGHAAGGAPRGRGRRPADRDRRPAALLPPVVCRRGRRLNGGPFSGIRPLRRRFR